MLKAGLFRLISSSNPLSTAPLRFLNLLSLLTDSVKSVNTKLMCSFNAELEESRGEANGNPNSSLIRVL
jgi:hypothetical protein